MYLMSQVKLHDGLVLLAYEIESDLIFHSLDGLTVTHRFFLNDFISNNLAMNYLDPGNNLLLTDS